MKSEMKLFDWPVNFCGDKEDLRDHPDFVKTYNPYMINRILSMSPATCGLALFMSLYHQIPKEQHFAFLNKEIDRQYIYFNYKSYNPDVDKKILYALKEYFVCSEDRALEYGRLLSEKQIETIVEVVKRRDDDQIKMKKAKKKKK
jgi:hypothetical protein